MSDIETIKARVAKLMAVAGDGVASPNEIESAMRLAAKLLDAHHLSMDECCGAKEESPAEIRMGDASAVSQSVRFSTWENELAFAISRLFGCVKWYLSHEQCPIRINGVAVIERGEVKRGRRVCFYGPALEAAEAADLFAEWSRSIATMGVARWGGAFRGDGAMYCMGFVKGVMDQVRKIESERTALAAKPLPALPGETPATQTAITLADRYSALTKRASDWLATEKGVELHKGSKRAGYTAGNLSAFAEGRSHGVRAGFGRRQSRLALPA